MGIKKDDISILWLYMYVNMNQTEDEDHKFLKTQVIPIFFDTFLLVHVPNIRNET
ncbi:hypothetical protein CLV81_3371 [Flagellimonas meridianipacifica]|uniref:Uncharacterized protein n=1 Tax=Flagellimonas meridianipacifica TaxID=1080225 RepID=A0A2T0MBV3_9FLAO|nr:hypothetical protein CLV81_3371 [Allomuricauda pacifica]